MPTISLTIPQDEFVFAEEQFPAFVAGFGTGKSHAAIHRTLRLKLEEPTCNVAYYLPTYDLVSKMAFPRFEETLTQLRLPYKLNKNEAVIDVLGRGQIIFRTMDAPSRIVAYEVADSIADELDTLPTDKAREVWQKMLGRNRQKKRSGKPNTMGVATTPEGFRFVYETWKKDPDALSKGYRLIKGATYSNRANLPPGYIEAMESSYPEQLISAYLGGEFVNLTSGAVYAEFDRDKNATTETIRDGEALHIGMDFNVGKMAAGVIVLRNGLPRAVDEFTDILDTPAMIAAIKARYWPGGAKKHPIFVYPDASGDNRKSQNASTSDLTLLRAAGFTVLVNSTNPFVRDRVLAFNQMICRRKGGEQGAEERRFLVNVDKCPALVEALEKQAYDKNGEPDKKAGLDHIVDGTGYCIAYRWPVAGRGMKRVEIGGI